MIVSADGPGRWKVVNTYLDCVSWTYGEWTLVRQRIESEDRNWKAKRGEQRRSDGSFHDPEWKKRAGRN